MAVTPRPLFDPPIVKRAVQDAFAKLAPAHMVRNPVMFVVLVGSVFTTFALAREAIRGAPDLGFLFQLAKIGVWKKDLVGMWENLPTPQTDLTGVYWK